MEIINIEPQITKEFLFSKGINQESIIQYYTGVDVASKRLFLSPFRADNKVTCSIYKSKSGILYIHDFATGEHINCFNVVMKLFNCNYFKALEIIAKDFGLLKSDTNKIKEIPKIVKPLKEKIPTTIQCQIKEFTNDELEWWNQFGINKKLLNKFNVYSIKHVFLNGELKFTSDSKNPIYGYYFGKDKNKKEKWKLYFPNRKEFRFIGNLNKNQLQGYKQLPKEGKLLVITKSMKDVISLKGFKIPAVAPNSETVFVSDKQLEEFKSRFKYILVIYDNDKAGKINLVKIRKEHPELNYFIMPKYLKKDFTDTLKEVGVDKMKGYIKEFLIKFKFK